MNIQDYVFKKDDAVITIYGEKGVITDICTCESCTCRGFYEPTWVKDGDNYPNYITLYDAQTDFSEFYSIGQYRFNDFEKGEVLRDIANYEDDLKKLRKQLKLIEEMEREEK